MVGRLAGNRAKSARGEPRALWPSITGGGSTTASSRTSTGWPTTTVTRARISLIMTLPAHFLLHVPHLEASYTATSRESGRSRRFKQNSFQATFQTPVLFVFLPGTTLFLEEDLYVSPDVLHVLRLMEDTEKVDMYSLNDDRGVLDTATISQVDSSYY